MSMLQLRTLETRRKKDLIQAFK